MKKQELKLSEVEVESSNIKTVAYDEENETLYVRFKPKKDQKVGIQYKYSPVRRTTHLELMAAESKGQFLNSVIKKDSGISYEKIEQD